MSAAVINDGLRALVHNLKRDDIATVEALLIDVCGNMSAGRILNRLMQWWPKATNDQGWVYKSADEWWAELRINTKELARAKGALETIGVEIRVMQAAVHSDKTPSGWAAAPVRHYRLNLRKFLKAVARMLKLTVKNLASLLKNPFAERRQNVLANGGKTNTTESSTESSIDNVAVVLDASIEKAKNVYGVSDAQARQWVRLYGAERVANTAAYILSRKWKQSPAGAFFTALRDQWECPPVQFSEATSRNEAVETAAGETPIPLPPSPDEVGTEDDDLPLWQLPEMQPDAPPDERVLSPERHAWEVAYGQLEIQLDRASFDTWLRGTTFLDYVPTPGQDKAKGMYIIGAPHAYARDMLQHRLYRDIRRVLSDVVGAPVDVSFEVHHPQPEPDEMPLFKLLARKARAS